jgi:gluconate 2-dehydrogenase gamma chain
MVFIERAQYHTVKKLPEMFMIRRKFIVAMLLSATGVALARVVEFVGGMPWFKQPTVLPEPVVPGPWTFFTAHEAATVEAIADRLIPADALSIGGREAGCALFIDRQLSGDFGKAVTQYRLGPVAAGTPQQGPQFIETPAERYRLGLTALDAHCRDMPNGKPFAELDAARQDAVLTQIESGQISLGAVHGIAFFNLLLQNVREGYFADPIYGGNKDMAGWRLLGFPGARYDFRDVIKRQGEDLKIIPISLLNQAASK